MARFLAGRRVQDTNIRLKYHGGRCSRGSRVPRRRRPTTDMNFWKGLLKQIARCSLSVYDRHREGYEKRREGVEA